MRERGGKGWNSKLTLQGQGLSLTLGVARKLEDVCQGLTLPVGQEEVVRFLANNENIKRINGLIEDVHEALMGYQVCMPNYSFSTMSYVCSRLHCNKISMMRVVGLL